MKTLFIAVTLSLVSHSSLADISAIDAAANTMNINELKQISEQSVDYEHAYAEYRTAITANIVGQRSVSKRALDEAQSTLESILTREDDAESMALLASVYGMQISADPSKGQILGMKSGVLLERAEQLTPNNPRIALVKAMSAFYTPTEYGGGMEKAKQFASVAIERYQNPCDDICWGHSEAYTWRGLAQQELGNQQGAEQDWQQAIDIDPKYAWANFLLNPPAAE
ncbi:tetratricopeptide repeat protein [Shewanella olleyana]|uniref:tetratricopeptide repeat protein n=1 Tax=Shewanella olleyana TaxID=135626 RepID=UPI00200F4D62|nr:tetratricopeptide repeat protein [Shewanella olleyana]MCL1066238.1 tetratricopeptide repeat protein [Shewanella olleyana]